MEEAGAITRLLFLLAANLQQVLLGDDVDLIAGEAGEGEGDAIAVVAGPLDVERRIIVRLGAAAAIFEQVEQTVEADGRSAIGGEVETVHVKSSMGASWVRAAPKAAAAGERWVRFERVQEFLPELVSGRGRGGCGQRTA